MAFTKQAPNSAVGYLRSYSRKMSAFAHALFTALSAAFAMGWEILRPLILGFALSGVVQAVVTKGEMSRLLPDSSHDEPTGPGGNPPAFLRLRLSDRAAYYPVNTARSFFANP